MNEPVQTQPESFGRYLLYPPIARGGMATVHTARLVGAEGFTRLVAAKRLHPQFTDDPEFVTMFHDEACIASRIHHPNVVPVLDVVLSGNELILVQEYVHGVPLSQLMKVAQVSETPIAIDLAIAILTGILAGLHGAHEVKDEGGSPLDIIHRDVSPANVMISVDGVPRLLDFGIAKARTSTHHTREGVFKGKLAYMAPEQLRMDPIDRTVDIYATGILAWELLVNRRVYDGRHELAFVTAVMNGEIPRITAALIDARARIDDQRWRDLQALESVIARAMSLESADRFQNAEEMTRALQEVRAPATPMAVAEWVRTAGADFLDNRKKTLAANEESWRRTSMYTPSSGMQRVTSGSVMTMLPTLPDDGANALPNARSSAPPAPPSGGILRTSGNTLSMSMRISGPPSAAPNSMSAMTTGTMKSAPPPNESGAFRLALGVSPLATIGARVRHSQFFGRRSLPWISVALFIMGGLAGGILHGAQDAPGAMPASGAAVPSAEAPAAPGALVLAVSPPSPPSPAAEQDAANAANAPVAATATPTVAPAAPPSPPAQPAVQWRSYHPPPPPPRAAPPARSVVQAAPPSAASPSTPPPTTTTSKNDCNPPFYFEGTKKVFKPSCL